MQYASDRVLFEGEWTEEERAVVEAAAAAVEREHPHPAHYRHLGKPWVCSCIAAKKTRYYLAQWSRRSTRVLTARSAEELAAGMRALARKLSR